MKSNLTDHGLGVMLMLRGPGGFGGGAMVDSMVSQLDIFPTVCDVAGIPAPTRLRGRSLTALAGGGAAPLHAETFGEVTYHAAYEPQRTVRTDRHRYIRRFEERDRLVAPNVDAGPSKTLLVERGWRDRERPAEMLFDLTFDPQEAHNLVGDPASATVLADLRGRLQRWMQETGDPLLAGPVPAPPGAVVDDQDAVDPGGAHAG
jgi:arylsulfatase A-like enzyme